MNRPKIKHLQLLKQPIIRKRDGAELTHVLHLAMTTDEALAISDMFNTDNGQSATSLISAALLIMAEEKILQDAIVDNMAKWRTREALAKTLSDDDVNRAIGLLLERKKPKTPPVAPAPVKKPVRRVFIP